VSHRPASPYSAAGQKTTNCLAKSLWRWHTATARGLATPTWDGDVGKKLLSPQMSLDDVAAHALQRNVDERPVSGRQEAWENLVNEYIA